MRGRLAIAVALAGAVAVGAACGTSSSGSGACGPGDSDGITGGSFTFDLAVTDTAFSPILLKAQNRAYVTLTLTNNGSRPHDLVIDCLATPNDNGCPATSCFADAGIGAVAPGASATATFTTPNPEGIYDFRSDLPGDTALTGQFIVQ
ncbi:MAG TPA: hypothetical protein VIF15_13040 [Polyangiaceae bacterium]|jgi:hypothetical protein